MDDERASVEVIVGRIGRPHGIRGEVGVEPRTDEPRRRFADGTELRLQPPAKAATTAADPATWPRRLSVVRTRWHQQTLLVTFAELADRTAAEAIRGGLLLLDVPADEQPEDPEEFYDHHLIGLAVDDLAGVRIGEVRGVLHGAQDLLQIRAVDGRDTLVPFVAALVPEVDLDAGRLVVADRPGLVAPFDDGPAEPEQPEQPDAQPAER